LIVPVRSAGTGSFRREAVLVREAQRGDAHAYAELIRTYERSARRVAAFVAGPNHADEVAQRAFINALRGLRRFEVGRPFEPWLLQIVVNEARSARRAEGRQAALVARESARLATSATSESAEAALLRGETTTSVNAALARLSPKHRDVVHCRYLLELSEEETAEKLGVRPGTVKSRLSRALDMLRTDFERSPYDDGIATPLAS
jgi:RNA polymerase sigma-70 factor (ECF subfamily)